MRIVKKCIRLDRFQQAGVVVVENQLLAKIGLSLTMMIVYIVLHFQIRLRVFLHLLAEETQ